MTCISFRLADPAQPCENRERFNDSVTCVPNKQSSHASSFHRFGCRAARRHAGFGRDHRNQDCQGRNDRGRGKIGPARGRGGLGKAERNEPGVPTLDKVVGLKYESDFELWLPVAKGNGRFWFSVLNRGNDTGGLRNGILRRGGAYGWCAWQAKNVPSPSRS